MISIENSEINLKLSNTLLRNIKAFSNTFEKVVSGLRINKPSDDVAGFYVASGLNKQIRGLETANSNIQTAINMLKIADESVDGISDIYADIRELISKSCNGYLTPSERETNQKQINELFKQAQSLKEKAEASGQKLFSGQKELDKSITYIDGVDKSTPEGQALADLATEAGNAAATGSGEATLPNGEANEVVKFGKITLDSSGTETVKINGLTYYIKNNASSSNTLFYSTNEDGQITFSGNNMRVKSASGQDDKIIISNNSNHIYLQSGDGNDDITYLGINSTIGTSSGTNTIKIYGNNVLVDCGSGNDTIINNSSDSIFGIYCGDGDDVIYDYSGKYSGSGSTGIYANSGNDTVYNYSGETISITEAENVITPTWTALDFTGLETKVVDIDNKQYTIQNNYNNTEILEYTVIDGQIIFKQQSSGIGRFDITAASGQEDNIRIKSGVRNLYTGDGNDSVYISSLGSIYINTGDGDDNIEAYGDHITFGDYYGNNTLVGSITNSTIGFYGTSHNNVKLYDASNLAIFCEADETDLSITGDNIFIYNGYNDNAKNTITLHSLSKNDTSANHINITGDGDSTINLTGDYIYSSLGNGNDVVNANGSYNYIHTRDGNDVVNANGSYNYIYTGDGNDTVTGILYTSSIGLGNENDIANVGGNNVVILGESGNDNITISGSNSDAHGNDGDDVLIINSTGNWAGSNTGGSGNNTVIINGNNTRYTSNGTDNITVNGEGNHISDSTAYNTNVTVAGKSNNITLGTGDNNVTVLGNSNTINTGTGADNLYIVGGNNNTLNAGDGDDSTEVSSGVNNTISGGTGHDTIKNYGKYTTYSQMDELLSYKKTYSIQVSGDISDTSRFDISVGLSLSNSEFDVSTLEAAQNSLKLIDKSIEELTQSKSEITYQHSMLEDILASNMTRITNLSNSLSTVRDADTAAEYNNLLAQASIIEQNELLFTQTQENHYNLVSQLIGSIAS